MACDDPNLPYEFIPAGNACDQCTGMAGCYAEAPAVPVHENCQCTVSGPQDQCQQEIRGIQTIDDSYTVTIRVADYSNCGRPATPISFVIDPAGLSYS